MDIRILVQALGRDDVEWCPIRLDPYRVRLAEQLNRLNIHLLQFDLAPIAMLIQINRFLAIQRVHNDTDSHKPNHILSRTQIGSILHVLIHFYANLANARFLHKSREEIPCGRQPENWCEKCVKKIVCIR